MNKKYDEIVKLPCDKLAQTMSDITYLYEETRVPKQHYKKFLDECVQEELDTIVNNRILEVYVKTIKQIIEESPLLFVKALMCIDKKINPSSMRPYEQQALIVCASQFLEGKKKVQYLDDSVYELFDEIITNGTKRILELSDDEDENNNKGLN